MTSLLNSFGSSSVSRGPDHVHVGPNDSWHGRIAKDSRFPPETDRYHLYVGLFCPFAHRANIVRSLRGLQDTIPVSIVKPYPKGDDQGWPGWQFRQDGDDYPGADKDPLFGAKYLHEIYFKDDVDYKGRYSVPLLWDKKANKIVNNESAELLRWLPSAFDSVVPSPDPKLDLYPESLRPEIDTISEWMQKYLNTGVYKTGFATDQAAYDANVPLVFAALNKCEALAHSRGGPFFLGSSLTELDIRLYATLIRFDVAYVEHFKCNLGTIRHDYPVLHNWLKNLYWNVPGFKETTNFKHIKENYTKSHTGINPRSITPMGPWPDVEAGPIEPDFRKLQAGCVDHPAVLEAAKQLPA